MTTRPHGQSCPDCLGVIEVHNGLTFLIHSSTCPLLALVDVARRIGEGIEVIDVQSPTLVRRTPRPQLVRPRSPTSEQEIPRAIEQLFDRFCDPPQRKRRDPEKGLS
jgi:hypothetical protein